MTAINTVLYADVNKENFQLQEYLLCSVKGVCARALRLYSNEDSAFRAGEHYDCTFLVRKP